MVVVGEVDTTCYNWECMENTHMKCVGWGQVHHTRKDRFRDGQMVDTHRVRSEETDRDWVHKVAMTTVGTCEDPQHRVGIRIVWKGDQASTNSSGTHTTRDCIHRDNRPRWVPKQCHMDTHVPWWVRMDMKNMDTHGTSDRRENNGCMSKHVTR